MTCPHCGDEIEATMPAGALAICIQCGELSIAAVRLVPLTPEQHAEVMARFAAEVTALELQRQQLLHGPGMGVAAA